MVLQLQIEKSAVKSESEEIRQIGYNVENDSEERQLKEPKREYIGRLQIVIFSCAFASVPHHHLKY